MVEVRHQEWPRIYLNWNLGILIHFVYFYDSQLISPKWLTKGNQSHFSFRVLVSLILLGLIFFCAETSWCNNFVGQPSARCPEIIELLHLLSPVNHKRTRWHVFKMHRQKHNNQLLEGQKGFMLYVSFLSKVLKNAAILSLLDPATARPPPLCSPRSSRWKPSWRMEKCIPHTWHSILFKMV
jgi:hypothetical protein